VNKFWRLFERVAFACSVLLVAAMFWLICACEVALVKAWWAGGNGWYPAGAALLIGFEIWLVKWVVRG
jgi:hypothetical protein